MTRSVPACLLLSVAACCLFACESKPAPKPKKIDVPPLKCSIDPKNPGPLRRGGIARVKLDGHGVAIDVDKANAWCGPLFNTDVPALNIKAGEGVLFETCLPDGMLQLSAYDRPKGGKQEMHSAGRPGGVELLFNQNGGPSYSSHGEGDDSIVFSPDLWQAEARVLLRDVGTNAKLVATVTFDCRGYKTGATHPKDTPKDAGVSPTAAEGAPKVKIEEVPVPAVAPDQKATPNAGAPK